MAELRPARLRRHAVVPEDHPREGRRAGRRAADADQGARLRRGVSAQPARLRSRRAASHGYQAYATADLGHASPTKRAAREGLVVDEGVIVEIVRPGTGDPVRRRRGRRSRRHHALQRRLSADPLRHRRPVGGAARALARAAAPTSASRAGWAAPTRRPRCKGMFVHPAPGRGDRRAPSRRSRKARLVVDNRGRQRPHDAARRGRGQRAAQADAIVASIRDVTKLRGEVAFRAPGELPNDGKVIDDVRKYD